MLYARVAYYYKSEGNQAVARVFREEFEAAGARVDMVAVEPVEKLSPGDYPKGKPIALVQKDLDVSAYDWVVVGTPVWNFSPSPVMEAYVRALKKVEGKRFILFSTCVALPGTTLNKLASILATMGARVEGSITVRSLFAFDEKKLAPVRALARALLQTANKGPQKRPGQGKRAGARKPR